MSSAIIGAEVGERGGGSAKPILLGREEKPKEEGAGAGAGEALGLPIGLPRGESGVLYNTELADPSTIASNTRSSINKTTHTALSTLRCKKLKGNGFSSPTIFGNFEKSMVAPSSRAGVPVCKRPSWKPAFFKDADKPIEGSSLSLPAGNFLIPVKINQFR